MSQPRIVGPAHGDLNGPRRHLALNHECVFSARPRPEPHWRSAARSLKATSGRCSRPCGVNRRATGRHGNGSGSRRRRPAGKLRMAVPRRAQHRRHQTPARTHARTHQDVGRSVACWYATLARDGTPVRRTRPPAIVSDAMRTLIPLDVIPLDGAEGSSRSARWNAAADTCAMPRPQVTATGSPAGNRGLSHVDRLHVDRGFSPSCL